MKEREGAREKGEQSARVYFKSVVSAAPGLPRDDDARAKEA